MNTRYSIPIVCTAVFVAMIFMVVVYIDPESFGLTRPYSKIGEYDGAGSERAVMINEQCLDKKQNPFKDYAFAKTSNGHYYTDNVICERINVQQGGCLEPFSKGYPDETCKNHVTFDYPYGETGPEFNKEFCNQVKSEPPILIDAKQNDYLYFEYLHICTIRGLIDVTGSYDLEDPLCMGGRGYIVNDECERIGKYDPMTGIPIVENKEQCDMLDGNWDEKQNICDSKYGKENEDIFTQPMKNAIFDEFAGHYDYLPINNNPNMMAMEKITLQDNGSIDVEFGQNNYEWSTGYKPIPEFEYDANFKVNDTFVVLCVNIGKDGYAYAHPDLSEPYLPGLGIVKYLGPITIENEPILLFWHESASIPVEMSCSYPEMIHHSINLWQLQEHGLPTDSITNALGSNYQK